ncbi:hypothetical protein SAMN05660657_05533 [Geodermatophilus amargosae]|uniref:Uncharacterized protein n=1 Tax=Geodermatophilus amargosae TaxID=1296565 RepID=A0A1I7DA31_9ACTN|nr:hypothetical protein [Geodermatophilus amargosae]SFU08541.1 hypothetical protein SAMN05660657_05533 [Geodermatophilus amargosae]
MVSLVSYCEQRSVNESQRDINQEQRRVIEEARADEEYEYAIRVSWWVHGHDFYIQNRSLVPIRSVILRYGATFTETGKPGKELMPIEEGPLFLLDSVAPCTVLTVNTDTVTDYYLGPYEDRLEANHGIYNVFWKQLDFTDAHGRWSVVSGGTPESVDQLDLADLNLEGFVGISDLGNTQAGDVWYTLEQPASDCGSG